MYLGQIYDLWRLVHSKAALIPPSSSKQWALVSLLGLQVPLTPLSVGFLPWYLQLPELSCPAHGPQPGTMTQVTDGDGFRLETWLGSWVPNRIGANQNIDLPYQLSMEEGSACTTSQPQERLMSMDWIPHDVNLKHPSLKTSNMVCSWGKVRNYFDHFQMGISR